MLKDKDPQIYEAICLEQKRQEEHLELIASENYVSKEVLEAAVPFLLINMQKDTHLKDIMVVVNILMS